MATAVIYARVSSTTDRQNTDRQVVDLQAYAQNNDYNVVEVFSEHVSGAKKNNERPILCECLSYCTSNNIHTLLISELSRLGRNVDEVLENVRYCKNNNLNIFFQKENINIFNADGSENPYLTIMLAVLGTCAQLERENIKYRLNSGRQQYIANGGKLGRKVGSTKSNDKKKEEYKEVLKLLKKGTPIRHIAKICGVGVSTVQRLKKEFNI
ncbi:MAG: DNA resolvase [Bacteroidales bacterium]|nr:DNA resolvase [Bacteroidales bacterium]